MLCLAPVPVLSEPASDLAAQLQAQLPKPLTLRAFHSGNLLRFDAGGRMVEGGPLGPWTLDGLLELKSIEVAGDILRLRAYRLAVGFDKAPLKTKLRREKDRDVTIEVALPANATEEAAGETFFKVFL